MGREQVLLVTALLLSHLVAAQNSVQSLSAAPTTAPAEEPLTGLEEGGVGAESSGPDSNAGASGEDTGAITLSKGGIAAIISVVVVVAVLGVASVILYFVAKRRQWKVRESIRRASRRLTGRATAAKSQRQSRRAAVRVDSFSPPKGANVEKGNDIEKGKVETRVESAFDVDSPKAKTWKSKLSKPTATKPAQ